jgi:RNA polymerase sigma-70 factor (ECF subfamily)
VAAKARRRLGIDPISLSSAEADEVEARVDRKELAAVAVMKLDSLTPRAREAVRLRVCEERSYTEVARLLGCSEQAARVRVSRGLAALHDSMEELRGS